MYTLRGESYPEMSKKLESIDKGRDEEVVCSKHSLRDFKEEELLSTERR